MGLAIARPELLQKYRAFGENSLPITALAAAKASLIDTELVPARKKLIGDVRTETLAWLKSNGYSYTPSVSNCFMLETSRPGKEIIAAMAAKEIFIGRIWPAWPTQVRITVGTRDEMLAFRNAFKEVMASNTSGLVPPPRPGRLEEHPSSHLS